MRAAYVDELAPEMKISSGVEIALDEPDTILRVTSKCNAKVLDILVGLLRPSLRRVGFTTVRCADGGEALKL